MQKKVHSLIEATVNIVIGSAINMLVLEFVIADLLGIDVSIVQNITITGLYTIVSICRQYVLRRFFNHITHRKVLK